MLWTLIYFQKRNKFKDSHRKGARTKKSHFNVVHVDLLSKRNVFSKTNPYNDDDDDDSDDSDSDDDDGDDESEDGNDGGEDHDDSDDILSN